jgi:hypothetical protein
MESHDCQYCYADIGVWLHILLQRLASLGASNIFVAKDDRQQSTLGRRCH